MSTWTAEELDAIGAATELRVASRRTDGSLRPFVTVWVARAGDDLYVRSAYGPSNPWFRRALAAGSGRIRAAGNERDVRFETPGAEVDEAVTGAFHAKYDRYGAALVGTVVSAEAVACTLRLVPSNPSPVAS
jgi:hypothetical protein